MKEKQTVIMVLVLLLGLVLVTNLGAWAFEKESPSRIPEGQVAPYSLKSLEESGFYCEIRNDLTDPKWYYDAFDSGTGFAAYMDPAQCGAFPYPFSLSHVRFYLYDPQLPDYRWPAALRINVRNSSSGDRCSGPQGILAFEDFSIPSDSAYPLMMTLSLNTPCWVNQPFFLEIVYTEPRDSLHPHPSLLMDSSVTSADTCKNWAIWTDGYYYEWSDLWTPPPPGHAMIRAIGYSNGNTTNFTAGFYDVPSTGVSATTMNQPIIGFTIPCTVNDTLKILALKSYMERPFSVIAVKLWLETNHLEDWQITDSHLRTHVMNGNPFATEDTVVISNINYAIRDCNDISADTFYVTVDAYTDSVHADPDYYHQRGLEVVIEPGYIHLGSASGTVNINRIANSGYNPGSQPGIPPYFDFFKLIFDTQGPPITMEWCFALDVGKQDTIDLSDSLCIRADTTAFADTGDAIDGYVEIDLSALGLSSNFRLKPFSDFGDDCFGGNGAEGWDSCFLIPDRHITNCIDVDSGHIMYATARDSLGNETEAPLYFNKPINTCKPPEDIPLNSGWQWISTSINPYPCEIESLFADCWGVLDIVQACDGSFCIPGVGCWIDCWNVYEMYKLHLADSCTIQVPGSQVPTDTPIPLDAGWSCIAYLPACPLEPEYALASIWDNLDIVKNDVGEFCIPGVGCWIECLEYNEGYKVHLSAADLLTYPTGCPPCPPPFAKRNSFPGFPRTSHFNHSANTGESYSIVVNSIQLGGESPEVGDEIAVFTPSGLCVGGGVWQGEIHGIAAWKDDDQTGVVDGFQTGAKMVFKFWDRSENKQIELSASFERGDDRFGTDAYALVNLKGVSSGLPQKFELAQNYPNPFNPETKISYALPKACHVRLTIYNLLGQKIKVLVDENQTAGTKDVHWNGKDDNGKEVASGIYFYKLDAGEFTQSKRMVLLK